METPPDPKAQYQPGDVFQINESEGRKGWIGCLVMADQIRPWGIRAFISVPQNATEQSSIFVRLEWSQVDYIGRSDLVPRDLEE